MKRTNDKAIVKQNTHHPRESGQRFDRDRLGWANAASVGQLVAAAAEEVLPVATEAQRAELAVEAEEHVAVVGAETFAFEVEAAAVAAWEALAVAAVDAA